MFQWSEYSNFRTFNTIQINESKMKTSTQFAEREVMLPVQYIARSTEARNTC